MFTQPKTAWGRHVRAFMDNHPGVSYKQAQQLARNSYQGKTVAVCAPPQGTFNLGTFNILARGLERDGFLCAGGEEKCVNWDNGRGEKVAHVLAEMIKTCACVVTQENDEYFWLLNKMRELTNIPVKGYYCIKAALKENKLEPSNARTISVKNMLLYFLKRNRTSKKTNLTVLQIEGEPNAKGLGLGVLKEKWDEMYAAVNEFNQQTPVFPTFRSKLGDCAPDFAKLYGKKPQDVYVSDDGIGFYINPFLAKDFMWSNEFNKLLDVKDVMVSFNKDGFSSVEFEINQKPITVFGAHLPSGENAEDEAERIKVLNKILTDIKTHGDNPTFILMDSNTNYKYEQGFPDGTKTLSQLIGESRFEDAVPSRGMECFKMRSTKSDQPAKACELMFDTIDKQLYPVDAARPIIYDAPLDQFGFVRYDPKFYNQIKTMRTNPSARQDCKTKCKQVTTDDALKMFPVQKGEESPFHHIYPGPNAPSDHPPVMCSFVLYEKVIPVSDYKVDEKKEDVVNPLKMHIENNPKSDDVSVKMHVQDKPKSEDVAVKMHIQDKAKISMPSVRVRERKTIINQSLLNGPNPDISVAKASVKQNIFQKSTSEVKANNKSPDKKENVFAIPDRKNRAKTQDKPLEVPVKTETDAFLLDAFQKTKTDNIVDENEVNCTGLSREMVLCALYNEAAAIYRWNLFSPDELLTNDKAKELLDKGEDKFSILFARRLNLDFSTYPKLNTKGYDEAQDKPGKAKRIINELVEKFVVNCEGLTKEAVLSALYNATMSLGFVFGSSRPELPVAQAKLILQGKNQVTMIDSSVLNLDFTNYPLLNTMNYDKARGEPGKGKRVIEELKKAKVYAKSETKVKDERLINFVDGNYVDCSGLDPAAVLCALYNGANKLSFTRGQPTLSFDEAQKILRANKEKGYETVGSLQNRSINVDFSTFPNLNIEEYDRMQRDPGRAEKIIKELIAAKIK